MREETRITPCIARRTRAREAQYFRDVFEKRSNRNGDGGSSFNGDGRKSKKPNGDEVRVRDSQKFENKKEKKANHAQEAISLDSDADEDEPVQVQDEGSISLNNNGYNTRTAEHSINAVKQFISSSEDEDVYGDDGDRNDDVKGGRFDEDAEEEEARTFRDRGDKGSFNECNGRTIGESDGDEVHVRDSPLLQREKAKEAEFDPGRSSSVAISIDSEEDEAAEIENEVRRTKGGRTFDPCSLENEDDNATTDNDSTSAEESTSSSEDEEDSDGTSDEDEEEEEERSAGRKLKRKRSFKVNVPIPAKKRSTHQPMSNASNVCIAQRTRSRFGWGSSVKNGRNRKVEEVEMKDGGVTVKGEGLAFHFISSDTEDDLPDKCPVSVDESTSSSENGDGDEEDSDDTYEEGDEDEDHGGEEEEEEEEEEERSVERLKRKKSPGVGASVSLKKDKNIPKTFVSNRKDKAIPNTSVSDGGATQLNRSNFNWKPSEKKNKNEEEVEEERSVESLKRKSSSGVQVSVSVEMDKNYQKTFVRNSKDKAIPDTFVSNGGAAQLDGSNFNWKSSEKKSTVEEEVEVEVEEERSVESLKRKRFSEVQVSGSAEKDKIYKKIFVSNRKDKAILDTFDTNGGAAQLNGSNFNWKSSEKKSKNEKLESVTPPIRNNEENVTPHMEKNEETVTRPICYSATVIESLSESSMDDKDNEVDGDEVDNGIEKTGGNNINNADDGTAKQAGEKEDDELGEPMKKMHVRAPKSNTLFKLFVNTIWENGEPLQQDLGNSEDEAAAQEVAPQEHVAETPLPLKFYFGIEKPEPKEKSDYEKEMDHLWNELDFALSSCKIGSFASTVDVEDANERQGETDPSTSCELGKHHFILDEQIGIICRFCSVVQQEIKYVLPSMATSPWERFGKRNDCGGGDFSMMDGVEFQDNGGDCQGSSVNTRGTIWEKFPEIRKKMFPHQQDGFEFIWKNLAGGIDLDVINSNGSDGVGGCVISHAPGTGKTFLTIAFLYTYMEIFKECRPLIIAPCSMLLTWEEEFKKWKVDIPFHNLNTREFSGNENVLARKLVGNKPRSNKWNRIVKLYSWSRGKSILGISYNLYEKLTTERSVKSKAVKQQGDVLSDKDCEDMRMILLERPTLLVLDEGHTPRNDRSCIWKTLGNIKTERRIILSGTPFQNNFKELYNTLWLVRPTFADRISCKTQKNGRKSTKVPEVEVARGKWASLTSSISINADDEFLEEVRTMIEPFVHVHRGSILQKNLPGLRDCVVLLNPPPLQKQILKDIETTKNSFELEHVMSLVSIHSSLLAKCNFSGKDKDFMDNITEKSFKLNPNEGVKTRFLMELIRLSEVMNEKVLVFSQYIDPLALIKDQFQSLFNWTEGKEVLQIDGKLDVKIRQSMINLFNDPCSNVRVLLASTRACREGINLVGASRIVLLDVVWNPSVERQAISRAYRLGQKKVVYTYHLITSGTKEADKYCRQVLKDRLSNLVFSTTLDTDKQKIPSTVSDDKILKEMIGHQKLADMFDQIIYQPKESDLVKTFASVTSNQTGNASFVD